ncbi:flagellar hook-length control protein FliK [Stappia sp. ES.058]|uniref:flagellar hook-length control protein FliK n=1 Tax=Stappia sp. ES.058 TaxID=1881061 RepID=UPI00087C54F2|nr:flagellar hook-length control protein FliK [Stappia sp. ES.058]SDU19315.1 hook-length control protein FliK [Stappia sp. ES.058]
MVSRVSTPTGVVAVTPVTRLPPLSVGDVIAMRVARHMTDGVMRLVSGNLQLDVAGQQMFPVGARVALHVGRGPDGALSYQVSAAADDVPGQGAQMSAAAPRGDVAFQRLSTMAADLAARQDGLAPLFSGLSAATASPASAALPQPVLTAMAALFGLRLVADGKLDGARLKRAIAIAAGSPKGEGARGGLPAVLKDLGEALRASARGGEGIAREGTPPAPPSLSRHPQAHPPGRASADLVQALSRGDLTIAALLLLGKSDAALARVRLSGLTSLGVLGDGNGAGDGTTFDRTLDLPFASAAGTGVISLQIGRDDTPGHDGEGEHPAWRVRFGIDTGESGPVEAVVGLDGTRLFATLWAERGETASALSENLSDLREMLWASGLEVVELRVLPGLPGNPPAASGQYVDRVS